ncbi:MAG: hypothetical protein ACI8ZX_000619 [Planctomycetota bacterium]
MRFFFSLSATAQYKEDVNLFDYNETINEVLITVFINEKYSFDTYVLIKEPNILYLDIEAIFKALQIKCIPELNNLVGFIENEKNLYTINFEKKQITIGRKTIDISNGILEDLGRKYIKNSLLLEAFGLNLIFNPRSLTAKLKTSFETPFIKEQKRKKKRENILKLQGKSIIVDTIITRDYHLLKLGTFDWGINSLQTINTSINSKISLGLGTELLFGEANFLMNYNPKDKFNFKDIVASWRLINNDHKFIKQANIGQVSGPESFGASSSSAAVTGVSINNTPNTVRKATGFYTITNTTEPNWSVELYLNDALINYTQADAAGLYVFKVPIVYGITTLTLKFYGPLGEVITEQRTVNNPYTVVPVKKLEYSLTTGIVKDSLNSRFGKTTFNYGVTRFLTVTGGLQYLSSNTAQPITTFASASFQPFSAMLLNVDYTYDQGVKAVLDYYVTKEAFLQLDYTQFLEGKLPRTSSQLREFKVNLSTPLKNKFFSGFTNISFRQNSYEAFNYNQFNLMLSSTVNKISVNSTISINWASGTSPEINSNLALSYRFLNGLALQTKTAYNFTENSLNTININLQKKISKINLNCSFQRDFQSKSSTFSLSANYALPFSNFGFTSSYSGNNLIFGENAQGSIAFGGGDAPLKLGNNSALGKGGFLLYPYLDLNANGKFDSGEKKVFLPYVKVIGAKAVISKKDSIVRVFDLSAFTNYKVEFSDTDLSNIAWRFKHKTYKILVDPNQYKRVFVPVIPVGEIVGMVYLRKGKSLHGQDRITIEIIDEKGNKIAKTLSEYDGYYTYLGLKPGKYTVRLDEKQLKSLNLKALPAAHQITVKVTEYGDVIEGLDFTLSKIVPKKPK